MKKTLLTICLIIAFSTFKAQTTITLKPNASDGKDAYIDSRLNTQNFETHPDFLSIGWTNGSPVVGRSLIQFDLSQIPQGATITSANLSLFGQNSASNGSHSSLSGSNESEIIQITSSWDESTVNWDNQPTISGTSSVILPENTVQLQNYTVNVTDMIIDMYQNNNYGMILKLIDENYYRRMVFASSDHPDQNLWPEITITYTISNANISDIYQNKILIAPNPVLSELKLVYYEFNDKKYEILNELGQVVQNGNLLNSTIVLKNLESGIYFLKINNETTKFIKS